MPLAVENDSHAHVSFFKRLDASLLDWVQRVEGNICFYDFAILVPRISFHVNRID